MPILDAAEIEKAFPFFNNKLGHSVCKSLMHFLYLDAVNDLYDRNSAHSGPDFANAILKDCKVDYSVAGYETIRNIEGPFITISNHPYGGIDGIILIDMIGELFPEYKLIVNDFLSRIKKMSVNFISVTPAGNIKTGPTDESIKGIREALQHIHSNKPIGIFPAGAVSNLDLKSLSVKDREWQISIIRLIKKARLPIIPIRFFDGNSAFYYLLGLLHWKIRVMRLPAEVFNKKGKNVRLGIGNVISVSEQSKFKDIEEYSNFLRNKVYGMEKPAVFQPINYYRCRK